MKKALLSSIALLAVLTLSLAIFQSCNTDKCKNVTCQNGGTCTSGTCSCPTGYYGTLCDSETRAKFLVSGSFSESCGGTANTPYNISITKGSTVTGILISDLGNYNCTSGSYTVAGTMTSSTTFTIPSQTICSTTFSGSGTITGGKVVISYTATYTVNSQLTTDNCTATQN